MLIKTQQKPLIRRLPTKCTNDTKSEETELTTDWTDGRGLLWVLRLNSVRGFVRQTSEARWGQRALPWIHQFSSVRSVVMAHYHHSRASIRLLMPLPMPSSATLSPAFTAPCSTANASAVGKAAEPVFPRVSNVEKSRLKSSPTVS